MKRFLRLLLLRLLALLARPFARRPTDAVRSVLYIKPDHLGDLLLATPVLAALRNHFPAARVTALVGPWSEIVLRRNPDVNTVLICPFPGFERIAKGQGPRTKDQGPAARIIFSLWSLVLRLRSSAMPYLTLLRYAALLRAGGYDLAIVGRDDHWWGAALALLAGVPLRAGFAVRECRPFLTAALPWDPRAHVTEQGLALVARSAYSVGSTSSDTHYALRTTQYAARFDPSPADIAWADEWIAAHGLASERLVVIHPGTGGPAKLWFADRWARVAGALQGEGFDVVLTGGPGEERLVADVAGRMRARPLLLAGQTGLGELAALLRRATLVLGVDSGPLHLAAAQGTPSVHLYGPGDDGRFGPWGDRARHVVVRDDLWCSPCGVFGACPRGLERPECMERIAVERVVGVARRLLAVSSRQ